MGSSRGTRGRTNGRGAEPSPRRLRATPDAGRGSASGWRRCGLGGSALSAPRPPRSRLHATKPRGVQPPPAATHPWRSRPGRPGGAPAARPWCPPVSLPGGSRTPPGFRSGPTRASGPQRPPAPWAPRPLDPAPLSASGWAGREEARAAAQSPEARSYSCGRRKGS